MTPRRGVIRLLLASLWLLLAGGPGWLVVVPGGLAIAQATPPPDRIASLARGVSITGWFRFPSSADPAVLGSYASDPAIRALRAVGFTAVRLAVQPEFVLGDSRRFDAVLAAIRQLHRHELAVVVDAHPAAWHLEDRAADRAALSMFWRTLAPRLRTLNPRLTFAELLNEPVFPGAADRWAALQHALLAEVRAILPQHTIILTGNDWGSVAGLQALAPEADGNVLYSVHLYEPTELTALAAYRPDLDRSVLARLPFPAEDRESCDGLAGGAADAATAGLIRFYCAQHWNVARIAGRVAEAAAWGRRHDATVWLGEFGASTALNRTARLAWLDAVRTASESAGIGWSLWGYDDVMGFSAPRPPGAGVALDPGVLRALGFAPPVSQAP